MQRNEDTEVNPAQRHANDWLATVPEDLSYAVPCPNCKVVFGGVEAYRNHLVTTAHLRAVVDDGRKRQRLTPIGDIEATVQSYETKLQPVRVARACLKDKHTEQAPELNALHLLERKLEADNNHLTDARNALADLERRLRCSKTEFDEAQEYQKAAAATLATMDTERRREELQNALIEAETDYKRICVEAYKAFDEANADLMDMFGDVATLRKKTKRAPAVQEDENAEAQERYRRLARQQTQLQDDVKTKQMELFKLAEEEQRAKRQLQLASRRITELERDLSELNGYVPRRQHRLTELEASISVAETEVYFRRQSLQAVLEPAANALNAALEEFFTTHNKSVAEVEAEYKQFVAAHPWTRRMSTPSDPSVEPVDWPIHKSVF